MQNNFSYPLLPGPLWPGVVAPDRVLSKGQIELNCILMLNWIVRNRSVYMCKATFRRGERRHGQLSISCRSYWSQTWPIKWNALSSKLRSYRYCDMDAIWMHYLDANKTVGEGVRRQLHKNAASNIEQVMEATPHKAPYGHLPPITKTIQVRRTRHAGHCWRSRDELISDVLLWTLSYGRTKAERRARTYIQQLCEDTGCSPEDLPEAMNDREMWRERVRGIRAGGTTWWWWYV